MYVEHPEDFGTEWLFDTICMVYVSGKPNEILVNFEEVEPEIYDVSIAVDDVVIDMSTTSCAP